MYMLVLGPTPASGLVCHTVGVWSGQVRAEPNQVPARDDPHPDEHVRTRVKRAHV